ncbi:phytolongin Phyl2.2-like [Papaver somniferum]|uniref:phytolongin Phyl2.2-like n=1 Tax=Papaver somniferum TaxID=3469 RepID=UPI000E6FCA95|nr:phytolongin Phyl2.2-like [Papaver somniferum]
MIPAEPNNQFIYACVSKGTMILSELNMAGDTDIEKIASKCLEKAPNLHQKFSQTTSTKTYSFLVDGLFTYFAIFQKNTIPNVDGSERDLSRGLDFLALVKEAFVANVCNNEQGPIDMAPGCYNEEFGPIFQELLLSFTEESSLISSPDALSNASRNESLDSRSSTGSKICSTPLLGRSENKSSIGMKNKKKNKKSTDHKEGEFIHGIVQGANASNRITLSRECSYVDEVRLQQEARKKWRENVRIVLLVDLVICCILFLAWLFICDGFKCVAT